MKYLKIGITLLFIIVIVLFVLLVPRMLVIKNIICINQYGSCQETLNLKLENLKGKSLEEVKQEVSAIMRQDLFVKEYVLRYEIPDRVVINAISKKAKFVLKSIDKDKLALVDQDGLVLGLRENSTLPKVFISADYATVGEKVSKRELFALNLVSDLYYFYQVKEGDMFEDRLEIYLSDGVKVIFPLEGDRNVTLGGLKVILSGLNQDVKDSRIKKVSEIDLRFKNPVLK